MNMSLARLRSHRLTWAGLLALALVLPILTRPARTHAAPGAPRQSIAVLIVCNGRDPSQKMKEDRIVALIRQAMIDQDLPKEALPILVYHTDKPSEAAYCQKALGIRKGEVPFLGLAAHKDLVVKQVILREPNIQDPETSVARLFSKAFKLITGTDLQTVTPTPPVSTPHRPTPPATGGPSTTGEVRVEQAVTCRGVIRPEGTPDGITDVFSSGDVVYVNFISYGLKVGTTLHVRWYQGDSLLSSASLTSPRVGNFHAFFNRRPPWVPGRYRADIYADGKFKARVYFRINGN